MNKIISMETDQADNRTWCRLVGTDFDGIETFGVTADGTLLDVDGAPVMPGDAYVAARNTIGDAWKDGKFPVAKVTEEGRDEIIDVLNRLTTLCVDELTSNNIDAWCQEAENNAEWNGSASIEIEARYAVSGHTELVDIDGVTIEWVAE